MSIESDLRENPYQGPSQLLSSLEFVHYLSSLGEVELVDEGRGALGRAYGLYSEPVLYQLWQFDEVAQLWVGEFYSWWYASPLRQSKLPYMSCQSFHTMAV